MTSESVFNGFRDDYKAAFVVPWSPYIGALALVGAVVVLMANGLFWGVYGGVRLWGDWFNELIGLNALLGNSPHLDSPLTHRISLLDITLVFGAFSSALLAGQFRIGRPPPIEYLWGALGGTLMGIGATLAGGCTVGGFFTPVVFSSPAGWAMLLGLLAGSAIGIRALLWVLENITWGTKAPLPTSYSPNTKMILGFVGLALMLVVITWAYNWYGSDNTLYASRGILVVSGFALGFILHRSRFCFSHAIREPMMTGDGDLTKATILALGAGLLLGSVLLSKEILDPYLAIPATFWLGSLLGGTIFGVGMIFAGGCASGSLWRMGEGHLKLWVAVFFFAWSGSTFSAVLGRWEVMKPEMTLDLVEATSVGYQAYLPAMTGGWGPTYLISFAILALWYGLVRYNETTGRFTVF
jgi:uncharacterized protein